MGINNRTGAIIRNNISVGILVLQLARPGPAVVIHRAQSPTYAASRICTHPPKPRREKLARDDPEKCLFHRIRISHFPVSSSCHSKFSSHQNPSNKNKKLFQHWYIACKSFFFSRAQNLQLKRFYFILLNWNCEFKFVSWQRGLGKDVYSGWKRKGWRWCSLDKEKVRQREQSNPVIANKSMGIRRRQRRREKERGGEKWVLFLGRRMGWQISSS